MPSALAPTRCSEATPDELEQRLRFYARQIKSFRKTSLMYSSPELMDRIRQMERDYEAAVRQFYCRPPPSTPGLQGAAAAEQPTSGLQPDSRPVPKSASTPSTRRRGRRKRDAPAQVIGGPGDASAHATEGLGGASAPVPSLQGFSEELVLVLASEPCNEGFEEGAPPDPVSEWFKEQCVLVLASEPRDEGFEEEALPDPIPEGFKERFVLVLAFEPRD
ncbi:hypothetical protein ILYODFUR_038276 [Ilyodon furcidens]|uniref:Uncharacterized protein n=1 Tax=Ilyodon furcidens TaxID=33524 RepID=A0ABV0VL94_9TELE